MATETTPQTGGAAAPPAEPQQPAKTPEAPPAAVAPAKPEPGKQLAAAKAPDAPAGEAGPKRVSLKDDEDLPEDADLIELSPSALKKRLGRAANAVLRERFGTTDVDSIKKKLERADALEAAEEKRRRAALDEKARMDEDLKKERARADAAEARLTASQEERVVDREEGRIKTIAENHIKPKHWKYAARDFAEHLRDNVSKEDLDKMKDKDIDKWFAKYVGENPEFGKEPAKPEVKKEPLTNGAKDNDRPSAKGAPNMAEKTFKPGQPNSMSSIEARREAERLGYRY